MFHISWILTDCDGALLSCEISSQFASRERTRLSSAAGISQQPVAMYSLDESIRALRMYHSANKATSGRLIVQCCLVHDFLTELSL